MRITRSILVKFSFLLLLTILISCKKQIHQNDLKLWYKHPAKDWNEALPLGNGKLGVMVFGNTSNERIQLNDDSLWPADLNWEEPSGTKDDLNTIRQLLFKGQNDKADALYVEKFSNKTVVRSHQTLGDLFLDFNHKNITDYRRELNISNATSSITYKANGKKISEKVFVSNPNNVIVISLESEAKNGFNGKIRLTRPKDKGFETATTKVSNQLLIMNGEVTQRDGQFDSKPAPILKGVKFETRLKAVNENGNILYGDTFLELQNVNKVTLYIVSNSSYYYPNYQQQNQIDLDKIEKSTLESINNTHVKDYKNLFDRVELQVKSNSLDSLTTTERLARVKNDKTDIGLETMLFQFGRYLLISSSRKGTNPANLQGLWNPYIKAPWNSDYHLNINLQMNYWLANLTNLDELNAPLFDYIDKLVANGKVTAKKNFGCNGTFIPHASDLWASTWLRAPTAYWGCSVGAGGWLMQHYWQHYVFTKDSTFLQNRAFPAMEEVTKFYSDWLIEDPRDGSLISAPSTSPENRFYTKGGKAVSSTLGTAMDQQIIAEVFDNYIKASEILKKENPFLEKIKKQRKKLRKGFVIDKNGRILEWDRPYKETEPGHRHMSHLYGFHPGNSVSVDKTPKIFKAVKETLKYRLENGGGGTGWSRAWLINCSARLLDGEMAYEHIQLLLKKSMFNNLFDAHPPFQIDGNFGYTAGVTEMLLQSHEENIIRLLPALPNNWKTGSITGIKARGGITVDLYWKNNQLQKAVFNATHNNTFHLVYKNKKERIKIIKGENFIYKPKNNI
ncbi:glycoside hydrolase family 95 protein [Polaribacter uvawellassae]|uniref:glycoside hydrolase family 95 protein n=1 Tax=Polaribacter uvawellassae TaxID=3133495 RepID=UPI00321AF7D2